MAEKSDPELAKKLIKNMEELSGHWGYTSWVLFLGLLLAAIFMDLRFELWWDNHAVVPIDNDGIKVFYLALTPLIALLCFKLADESFYEYFRVQENKRRLAKGEITRYERTSASAAYNTVICVLGVAFYIGLWAFTRYVTFNGHAFEVAELWVFEIGYAAATVLIGIILAYLAAKKFDLRVQQTPGLTYGPTR